MRKLLAFVSIVVVCPFPISSQQLPGSQTRKIASASPPEATATDLPVRRVVLYKNGVGYFEHRGRVRGTQDIHIDFTSGQLNDALASLTVLDLDGGQISGVSYNSTAPFDKRLGALRLPVGEQTSVSKFLDALRGARLEVHSGSVVQTGRLLSVERKTRTAGGTTLEVDVIAIVTDGGEIREIELTPAMTVRLADRGMHEELNRYLSLLSSQREQDLRRMTLAATGVGERQLFVSYISEVPVWKTTYRLVLSSKADAKSLLQGWAIVDNTVGEDWNNVELSLVAGAPQSFIQQLSQPYYGRRAVVALPQEYQQAPQTHEARLLGGSQIAGRVLDPAGASVAGSQVRVLGPNGEEITRTISDDRGEYGLSGLPDGAYQLTFEKEGFNKLVINNAQVRGGIGVEQDANLRLGSTTQEVSVMAEAALVNTTSSATGGNLRNLGSGRGLGSGVGSASGGGIGGGLASGLLSPGTREMNSFYAPPPPPTPNVAVGQFHSLMQVSNPPVAEGQDLGDLFEYKLKNSVTIRKNQSAMVPIFQSDIKAEKVSVWSASLNSSRPLRGVWLSNTSSETLDGGNFSVLEDEIFAGQGLLEAIKPGERRLLSYATDLGMLVRAAGSSSPVRNTRVTIIHGVMVRVSEMREKRTYTVRNEDTSPRSLIIEHPARFDWSLSNDSPKPEETSLGAYRFRVKVGAKQSATLEINESHPLETRINLNSITDDQLALMVREGSVNPQIHEALARILEQKSRVSAIDSDTEKRDNEITRIYDDQQRLRENLKALKGSPEEKALTQRYTQQLSDQETRLTKLNQEKEDLEKKSEAEQGQLDKMLEDLAMEVTL